MDYDLTKPDMVKKYLEFIRDHAQDVMHKKSIYPKDLFYINKELDTFCEKYKNRKLL